jgi:hypothetical protein
VALAHPLGQQCEATAKSTGRRCERRAIGAPVCIMHGGKAAQVRRKAEERVLVAELEAKAAAETVLIRREPEELILSALYDVDQVLARIKADLHGGMVNPLLLELCGDWIDRLGRLTKIIVDGELSEKLEKRLGWMAEDRAATLWGHLAAIVEASPLTAGQRWELWQARFAGLELIRDGRAPYRLSNDEVHRFTTALQVAAAREEALAEGLPWGDSKSDSDLDEVDYGLVS